MENLHVLPTDKPSRIISSNKEFTLLKNYTTDKRCKNIYITSNEEIKEGDWFITTDTNEIHKSDWIKFTFNNGKKIILTTDQDLIKDGVQAIPDEFLEWFVKNPSCEEVEVKSESSRKYGMWKPEYYPQVYKIIIPSEEPKQNLPGIDSETFKVVLDREWFPKQETIEEYFLGKMKEVLLFKNDAQAIRFMEKYYQAKKEEDERNY